MRYLFRKLKNKGTYTLIKSTETYDPVTGDVSLITARFLIDTIPLSIDIKDLPENCVSSDTCFSILTTELIDSSDSIEDPTGQIYTIKYLLQTSFNPIIYEVILRAD